MPQNLPTETKTEKTKRKISLSLPQKLGIFHEQYPNGCIHTQQMEDQDCISYKAFIIPDVKTPSRFFTGHYHAGSKYRVYESSLSGKAENAAVARAFTFMGIGLKDNKNDQLIRQSEVQNQKQKDLKIKKPAVCSVCGRVWEHEINGNDAILRICPECKIKRRIFSKVRIV
jgi:predicted Zn-ribbon and HTH transcriptional regulator